MDTRISKDLGFISCLKDEKLTTLCLLPVGKLIKVPCTTVPYERPSPEKGLKNKWILPQNLDLVNWGESQSVGGCSEHRLLHCVLREGPWVKCPQRQRESSHVRWSNTSHTPSPQMSGQEQGKLPFALLSTSCSLKVSCSTLPKSLAETVVQEES